MKWLRNLKDKYQWRWVGTVEGQSILIGSDGKPCRGGNQSAYWNLYERGDGKRRSALVANHFSSSQASRLARASVKAWECGGPLPVLYASPEPKREAAKLVVFPGGRDGAA